MKSDWVDLDEECPDAKGRYLVVQQLSSRLRYRWVRYWDGSDWVDAKEEKYGPITHWMEMPPFPVWNHSK